MAEGFVHTVHADGRWRNSVEGDQAPLPDSFDTKEDAVEAGRTEARRRQTEHVIHNGTARSLGATRTAATLRTGQADVMNKWLTGEWFIEQTSARRRRVMHYWATILWLTVGLVAWVILRDALWFVGFMSLYAIWVTHIAGWAAETPVEAETADAQQAAAEAAPVLVEAEPS